MRGYSLIELMVCLVVMGALAAISIPMMGNAVEHSRLRGAAFHLSARLSLVRMQAVRRYANVALRFKTAGSNVRYQTFADGDGDGVKSADITSGRDVPLDLPEAIDDKFSGVSFGFVPGCPLVDGSAVTGSPVHIGSSGLLSYSPDGSCTSGTLYLRNRGEGYAVVLLGATGRSRLLHCDASSGAWTLDGR
jgi:prepilin-type N-terminal cleavage/methylation domain-containing protein